MVNVLIDSDFECDEIKEAFRNDRDIIKAVKNYIDEHEMDQDDYNDDDYYDDDDSDNWN